MSGTAAELIKRWGRAFDSTLALAEVTLVGAAMAFSSLLLFVNVVLRYGFNAPISWAEEISIYLVIWIVFIGASAIIRLNGHLAIDLLPKALSPGPRRILVTMVLILTLIFFSVFFYFSGLHVMRVYASGQVTPNLEAPMWLTYLAMPVGSALMALRTMQVIYAYLSDKKAMMVGLRIQE